MITPMKALSVRQPFAELMALGRKTIEVRSWRTAYRGPLLICAGVSWHPLGVRIYGAFGARGVAVCLIDLVDVTPFTAADSAQACLELDEPGLWAFRLANARRVEPTPMTGRLGLFSPAAIPQPAGR